MSGQSEGDVLESGPSSDLGQRREGSGSTPRRLGREIELPWIQAFEERDKRVELPVVDEAKLVDSKALDVSTSKGARATRLVVRLSW